MFYIDLVIDTYTGYMDVYRIYLGFIFKEFNANCHIGL